MKRETVPRTGAGAIVRQAEQELREYFAGRRRTFTVKLDLEGTEFQRKAWQAMQSTPSARREARGSTRAPIPVL